MHKIVLIHSLVKASKAADVPAQPPKTITILIADDHPAWIEGLRSIILNAPDMQVVGEVQHGEEIRQRIAELQPAVLLLDLDMPNHQPADIEKWVRQNYPGIVTLVLTAHDRDAYLAGMMEAGAAGYLDKKLRANDLLTAIRQAAGGAVLFNDEQMERATRWRQKVSKKWESLSAREREVLQLLTEGTDNQRISTILGISINTVEKHLKNIYEKLGVASRTEAIRWWVEKGTDFRN